MARITHIVRWYESIIDEATESTELDDYHRGYIEALQYVIRDLLDALK